MRLAAVACSSRGAVFQALDIMTSTQGEVSPPTIGELKRYALRQLGGQKHQQEQGIQDPINEGGATRNPVKVRAALVVHARDVCKASNIVVR